MLVRARGCLLVLAFRGKSLHAIFGEKRVEVSSRKAGRATCSNIRVA